MAIRIVRLGAPRYPAEGLRLGTVRRRPRGVGKVDYSRRDYFDVWLPDLAPSTALLTWARSTPLTDRNWRVFVRRYRTQMAKPPARRLIVLLAVLSAEVNFSVGCFCQDELRCHRSVLRELLAGSGA